MPKGRTHTTPPAPLTKSLDQIRLFRDCTKSLCGTVKQYKQQHLRAQHACPPRKDSVRLVLWRIISSATAGMKLICKNAAVLTQSASPCTALYARIRFFSVSPHTSAHPPAVSGSPRAFRLHARTRSRYSWTAAAEAVPLC